MKTLPKCWYGSRHSARVQNAAPQMAMGQAERRPPCLVRSFKERERHRSILRQLGGILKNPRR